MTRHGRLFTSIVVCTGLLVAGCSSGDGDSADSSSSATASAAETADTTGGSCDVATSSASADPSASADADASEDALGSVELSDDATVAPTVSFTAPLGISSEVASVAEDGDGDAIEEGQAITFNYVVCDVDTGEKLYSTWGADSTDNAAESYMLSVDNFGETLTDAVAGTHVGSQILWAQPGVSAEESSTGTATSGYLYAFTIESATDVLDSATGTEVTPDDSSLPVITFEDGKPEVSVPDSFTDPTSLVVEPLIEGDGETVETGQTVAVKYSGWLTDGTQFDSSYELESPSDVVMLQIGAGNVIEGWDEALVGQPVGSRLLLVIPSDLAYGSTGSGDTIPADSTLIFVVEIVGAF